MRKKKVKKSKILFLIKLLFLFCFVIFCGGYYIYLKLPNIDKTTDFRGSNKNNKIHILYSDTLENIKSYNAVDKDDVSYNELSPSLINALIATEDRRFFTHHGIDLRGIIRAFFINIRTGKYSQGGSTITQQLAKAILKDNSKNLKRKIKELVLTFRLEYLFTKEEILAMYLNINYFGAGQVGVKNASEFYFSKLPADLNIEESATLIGLLKAPSKFAPTINQEMARRRALQVIINMQDAGYIEEKDVFSYIIPNIQYSYGDINRKTQKYYFTDWVRKKIVGLENDLANASQNKEFFIATTLNSKIQNIVEEETFDFVNKNANKIKNSQLAVVVMNNNGEVLSMLGGKNYDESAFNRAIYAYRQTGSLFKLFVYLNGFEHGLKISDVFVDEPIAVKDWYPENYGKKYYGNIDLKSAFSLSSNSVAVQIAEYFGVNNLIDLAVKMGITSKFEQNDLTITLGTTAINLLEMVKAFAIVNNGGYDVETNTIRYIFKNQNDILYEYKKRDNKKLLSDYSINSMKELLYYTIVSGTGQNAKVQKLIDKTENYNKYNKNKKFFIGGKTGSSQNNVDAWFIGVANDLTIGIWMGNDDNTPTNNLMGGNLPAILWKQIVERLN